MQSQSPGRAHRKVTVYTPLPGAIPWYAAAETPPVKHEASGPASQLSSHPPSSNQAALVEPCLENIAAEDNPLSVNSAPDSSYVELGIEQPYPVKVEMQDPLAFHSPSNSKSSDVKLPQVPVKLEVYDPPQQQSVSCHRSTSTPYEPSPSVEHSQAIETEASYPLQQEPCKFPLRSCFVNLGPRFGPRQVKTEPCDSLSPLESPCPDNAEPLLTSGQARPDLFDPLLNLPASNISVYNLCNLTTSSNNCLEFEANSDVSLALDPLSDDLPTPPNSCCNTEVLICRLQTQTRTSLNYSLCGFNHEVNQDLRDPLKLEDSKLNIQSCFVNLGARIEPHRVKAEGVTSAGGSRHGRAAVEPQLYVPLANTRPWFTVLPEPRLLTTRSVKLELDETPLALAEGRSTSESPRTIGEDDDHDAELATTVDADDDPTCTSDSDQNEDGTESPRHNHQPDDSTPDTEVVRKTPAQKINQGNKCNASKKGVGQPRQLKDNTRGSTGLFHCNICSRGFKQKCNLKHHVVTHSEDRPFRCPSPCGKTFKLSRTLLTHSYTHMARKPFVCEICKKDYTLKSNLVVHMRYHSDVKPFDCAECGKGFVTKGNLTKHILSHSGDRPYKCSCGRAFKHSGDLKNHSKTHLAEKLFVCSFCGKSFTQEKCLADHELLHTDTTGNTFTCLECGKSYSHAITLKLHSYTHLSVKPEACKLCNKTFPHKRQLYTHVKFVHSTLRPFKCLICSFTCKTVSHLKVHSYRHTGEKRFTCVECDKGFVLKSALKTHMFVHLESSDRPVSCPHPNCGKTFVSESALKSHSYTHTGVKHFMCAMCDRGFVEKGALKTHMFVHRDSSDIRSRVRTLILARRAQVNPL